MQDTQKQCKHSTALSQSRGKECSLLKSTAFSQCIFADICYSARNGTKGNKRPRRMLAEEKKINKRKCGSSSNLIGRASALGDEGR